MNNAEKLSKKIENVEQKLQNATPDKIDKYLIEFIDLKKEYAKEVNS